MCQEWHSMDKQWNSWHDDFWWWWWLLWWWSGRLEQCRGNDRDREEDVASRWEKDEERMSQPSLFILSLSHSVANSNNSCCCCVPRSCSATLWKRRNWRQWRCSRLREFSRIEQQIEPVSMTTASAFYLQDWWVDGPWEAQGNALCLVGCCFLLLSFQSTPPDLQPAAFK